MEKRKFKHIQGGFYACFTQEGFKMASNDFADRKRIDREESMHAINGYPTSYPLLVFFERVIREDYQYILASSVHINNVLGAIE